MAHPRVEVTLVCSTCEAQSEPVLAHAIDRYTYHDAPLDGLDLSLPTGWVWDLDPFGDGPGFVLCPDHSAQADAYTARSRQAWHDRTSGRTSNYR